MNILIVGNAFPPTYMGGESIVIYNLVAGLRERGHKVVVIHPSPNNANNPCIKRTYSDPNLEVYSILLNEKTDGYLKLLNTVFHRITDEMLNNGNRFDLIHCHSNKFARSITDLVEKHHTPLISTIHAIHIPMVHDIIIRRKAGAGDHDLDIYEADNQRTGSLCTASDKIIGISNAMVNLIEKYYRPGYQKIVRVYNGIDVQRFITYPDPCLIEKLKSEHSIGDKKVVLFAGRIEPVKGIKSFTEACKEIAARHDDVVFFFIGNGSADAWLRSQFAGQKRIRFIDWVPINEIIPYYYMADIVAVPSLIEPFGLVAAEAMACRTCVIASNADGLDEIITHERDGIKTPLITNEFGDRTIRSEDIYRSLEKALQENEFRQALASQAVVRAEDFNRDRMVGEIEKVYTDVVN